MTTIVNCRFLTQPMTGVQRFADRIVDHLTRLRGDLMLVAPPGELSNDRYNGVPVQQVGTHQGHVWEQIDLPRYLRKQGDHSLLLNLANTGPVAWDNQIVTLHDISYVRYPESYSRKFRLVYNTLVPLLLRKARAVLTVSEFSKAEISEYYKLALERIIVIPNAVDESFAGKGKQPAGIPANVPYFLVVASLNLHKNVGPFVEAFKQYRADSGTETELWLVGGTARSFAPVDSKVDTQDGVRALGRVTDDVLVWLYRNARAFAFPSLYEGFGIPPLEAQRAGTAVLAANIPSLREVLEDTALLVSPGSIQSMIDGIRQLDTMDSLRAELQDLGLSNIRRFSWDDSASRLIRGIEDVLKVPRESSE